MTTALEDARKTLAKLQHQLTAKRHEAAELKDAGKHVSFDAYTGNSTAMKRLDEIHKTNIKIQLDIEGLTIAVNEATQRVEDAGKAEAMAAERAKAKECVSRLPAFRSRGEKIERLATEIRDQAQALSEDAKYFADSGVHINQRLVVIAVENAFQAIVDPKAIAPNLRHRLPDLVEVWAKSVDAFAAEILTTPKTVVQLPKKEDYFSQKEIVNG